ncbi:type I-E CRISPR-associated protein Cas7/Cse4/CasC [Bifidobacterium myosotis]|uniref:Type I-E CRISPR-associated protein Cas7/Cse4/CasC n=1 Tax=Bifidobacterium myosotis TaxID=1630166 RepID=A0A5M9ZKS5_9BIFI|nr:type I-E CRISPR-associated protein Cas7/Cse4/CasC [Bifidobacterium myosotis]KAA8828174.1 type I-E CRISPR-associated protein Cas7/Cse4/CasC [Bifidobacterium myosotis]
MGRFIDIHAIQAVGPACLNRDEANLPKTVVYGGVERVRVSSQCWKRAIRLDFAEADREGGSIRTKRLPRMLADRMLAGRDPADADLARAALALGAHITADGGKTDHMFGLALDKQKKTAKGDADAGAEPRNATLFLVGRAALDRAAAIAAPILDDPAAVRTLSADLDALADGKPMRFKIPKETMKAIRAAIKDDPSRDVQLFGRMAADDDGLTVDGCLQVAHAIGVAPLDMGFDFYAGVDDRNPSGAAMLGDIAYADTTVYRYATLDVGELEGRVGRDEAARMARELVESFLTVVPDARQHSFAARTLPALAMVEAVDRPQSRVAAYARPVEGDPVSGAVRALERLDHNQKAAWGLTPHARWTINASGVDAPRLGETVDLDTMLDGVTAAVTGDVWAD